MIEAATAPAPIDKAAPLALRRVDIELARVVAVVMVMTIHVAAAYIPVCQADLRHAR